MEDDLTWLARNVTDSHMCDWYIKVADGYSSMTGGTPTGMSGTWCSRKQIIQRRAELQNKPSWSDAPEWATHLAQNGRGQWWFMLNGKLPGDGGGYFESDRSTIEVARGEVLGDWRDTLERRPEQFKPFISIEDNQDRDMTQQQDMKQDNGWFERGELPPVGAVCLYVVSDRRSAEVEITAHAKLGLCFVEVGKSGENYVSKTAELHQFRPIRTEREVAIEEMCNVAGLGGLVFGLVAGELYDAGYRKQNLPAK